MVSLPPLIFFLLLLTFLPSFSLSFFVGEVDRTSTTCGGNCPGSCGSCPCGTTSNYQNSSAWCGKYSGWKKSSCECIISKESGGNANAVNQNGAGGSYDVGLWQINDMNWASCSSSKAPCDPNLNLECGMFLSFIPSISFDSIFPFISISL